MFKLTKQQIQAAGPCDLTLCDRSPRWDPAEGALVYPNGFDDAEVARIARDEPTQLLWLAKHGLVPIGYAAAVAAVLAARRR